MSNLLLLLGLGFLITAAFQVSMTLGLLAAGAACLFLALATADVEVSLGKVWGALWRRS